MSRSVMTDVAELVSIVFSGLSALVIEGAEDAGEVICVRARIAARLAGATSSMSSRSWVVPTGATHVVETYSLSRHRLASPDDRAARRFHIG